jgi:tRNA threonylcarbamoyladenosine modification (KEOPS) complex  Pcc1 subunit
MREDAEAIEAALVAEIETIKVERSEVRLQGHQDKLTRTV